MVVWGVPELRHDVEAIRGVLIDVPAGSRVPLGDVSDVYIAATPNEITREFSSRRIHVTCNTRDLGTVARGIEAKLKGVAFDGNAWHSLWLTTL